VARGRRVCEGANLPLDIVVQPQPTPGKAPLALAFVDGRCKLVLSMRENPKRGDARSHRAGTARRDGSN